ncbi:MAG: sensor histidine kinase [Candidatus Sericytochromatia bacterium]
MLTQGLHVLVIEDNPGDFFLLEELLNTGPERPRSIVHAQSYQEAKQRLLQFSADMILLDLSLPDSSGVDTFRQVFQLAPHIPIVVLSGLADADVALETVILGAQDYLVKGEFDEKMLYKVMAYSLERRRQLEELEHSESKYRQLFECNPQAMWVYNLNNGLILAANQAAISQYGYRAEEFLHMPLIQLAAPSERERVLVPDLEQTFGEAGIWEHQTRQGDTLYVNILWHQMLFEDQKACLVLAQDMTAKVLAEREKNLLIQELTQKNSHLEQFAYIVSHNLRAPVANLLGLCNLLQEEQNNTVMLSTLRQAIQDSALRMDDVIRHLNETLQIQRGQSHQAYTLIQLPHMLQDILNVYGEQLQEAEGHCVLHLEVESLTTIYSYLHSILENLISNAIKYRAPERPLKLEITSRALPEGVEIILCDNGLGIPKHYLEQHVFGMYKRFHAHVEGRGLGLFMCKNQIEALGGSIQVASDVGQGSTFRLFLPNGLQP